MNLRIFAAFVLFAANNLCIHAQMAWTEVEKGLWVSQAHMPKKSSFDDSRVTVLKIDPAHYDLQLLLASEKDLKKRPIDAWCNTNQLIAGINAGMFHGATDKPEWRGITNTGYTRNYSHVNNPVMNNDNAFIVFNPKNTSLPRFQILDKRCKPLHQMLSEYNSVIQGIRIVGCNKEVVWAKDKKKWSISIMCSDDAGNCLFVHCRSPYSVHDFMTQLLTMVPSINRAVYLEGGPESSLYLKTTKKHLALMGSYETRFWENNDNGRFWDIPNIIGIRPRAGKQMPTH